MTENEDAHGRFEGDACTNVLAQTGAMERWSTRHCVTPLPPGPWRATAVSRHPNELRLGSWSRPSSAVPRRDCQDQGRCARPACGEIVSAVPCAIAAVCCCDRAAVR
jgi:hypothetical protein